MDITSLQAQLRKFADERDWDKFHNPKNLAIALSIECAELLEIFQWASPDEAMMYKSDPHKQERLSEEIADIALYLIQLCDKLEIDLDSAITKKLKINADKYPAEMVKGSAKKYTEY